MKTTTKRVAAALKAERAAQIRGIIRALETEIFAAAEGSKARAYAQSKMDFQCGELALYADDC